ncbi:hypothetical protein EVAR_63416_1 [Eumeta japonica]|uniref:Uncharacterized protein n=1 Tax=Eumeta variegata TaxID=151549 RepID=A0A4C1YXA7_EUMVA|nr:hypothetical protein EVAR_63416_1 [Eumeta japonica]
MQVRAGPSPVAPERSGCRGTSYRITCDSFRKNDVNASGGRGKDAAGPFSWLRTRPSDAEEGRLSPADVTGAAAAAAAAADETSTLPALLGAVDLAATTARATQHDTAVVNVIVIIVSRRKKLTDQAKATTSRRTQGENCTTAHCTMSKRPSGRVGRVSNWSVLRGLL